MAIIRCYLNTESYLGLYSFNGKRAKCEIFRFFTARRHSTRVGLTFPGLWRQETNDVFTIRSQNAISPKNPLPPAIPRELTNSTKDVYCAVRYTADYNRRSQLLLEGKRDLLEIEKMEVQSTPSNLQTPVAKPRLT